MKKKFITWLFVNLIFPLIKDFAIYIVKFFSKYLLDLIQEKMRNWEKTEENNKKTEEEKIIARKKWKERINDIENIKATMDQNIDKVVQRALQNSAEKFKKLNLIDNNDQKLIK